MKYCKTIAASKYNDLTRYSQFIVKTMFITNSNFDLEFYSIWP